MNIFSRITAKTMAQSRTRTIVTIIGVILSTAMITAVTTFGVSFQKFLVDYSISRDGNWHICVKSLTPERAEEIREMEEVASAATVAELGYARFAPVQEESPNIPYLYVQALSAEALKMLPTGLYEGRMPENDEEVVIPLYLQANEDKEQKTEIGDTLTLELGERTLYGEHLNQNHAFINDDTGAGETFTPQRTKRFQVVGVYETWPNVSYGAAGYDVLAGPAEEAAAYQDLYLELENPRSVYDFVEENLVDESVLYNGSLLRWLGAVDNDNFLTVMIGLLTILVLVIIAGSITLIYNAFSISLRERTTQFGLLSSMGATKKQLRSSMRYEALFVSSIGIPVGILAGVGGIGITLHYIGEDITNWIHGSKVGIPITVSWWSVLAAAVIALVTVLISVWIPSRRIRKLSPMEAIRATADIKISPQEVKTGRWVTSLFGLEGMMAEKNYKRDRKKYRATVVSLTMSIVLFTAAALFNIYLTKTGSFVLDAPEVELQYRIYRECTREEETQAGEVLRKAKGVTSVFAYRKTSLAIQIPEDWMNSDIMEIYGYPELGEDGATPISADVLVLSDELFETFAKSQKVDPVDYQNTDHIRFLYLNEAKRYNSASQRYEKITVFEKHGQQLLKAGELSYQKDDVEFQVKCEAELGDPVSELPKEFRETDAPLTLLISEQMYEDFPGVWNQEQMVSLYNIQSENPSETFTAIEEALKQKNLEDVGYLENLTEQYESDKNALAAVNVLTYGFITLISLIAVANVFNTISTNLMLRRKEFAMLRSMGMSPKGLQKMMNYECLIYGMRAIFYGVILTVLLSIALQNVIGIGTDVDFLIPWEYLGIAVVGVFLVVFMTMLYTMRKIRKNNIVEELKMN